MDGTIAEMMTDCYQQLAAALERGAAVLATVMAVRGSVPREVGAKMVIDAAGQTFNTIGGGAGEAKVIRQALEVLQTGAKQFVEIDLTGSPQRQTEGVCGGKMQVWLERWQGAAAQRLVQQILQRLGSGQIVTLITPFASDRQPHLLPPNSLPLPAGLTEQGFTEQIQPPPSLLIIGAGHVGEQLAKVADLIGFQVIIQDDRPEWANPQRYPQATQILAEPIPKAIDRLAHYSQLYAALVTRGYQHDLAALQSLLQRIPPCQYLGMIGSEKRVRQVYQAIEQTGVAPEILRSIYAPIGLDIGALTPAEIAVSISAELILVRRGGTGQSLSGKLRQT
ncbi:MAG: XdhC family protein [Elainella sp. Prado103]|nr:XdhC family protein [Elainella sp. Prado103]